MRLQHPREADIPICRATIDPVPGPVIWSLLLSQLGNIHASAALSSHLAQYDRGADASGYTDS